MIKQHNHTVLDMEREIAELRTALKLEERITEVMGTALFEAAKVLWSAATTSVSVVVLKENGDLAHGWKIHARERAKRALGLPP